MPGGRLRVSATPALDVAQVRSKHAYPLPAPFKWLIECVPHRCGEQAWVVPAGATILAMIRATGGFMRYVTRLTAVAGLLTFSSFAQAQYANLLWYAQPATDWEKEALPLGNGRIGAMVFGGVESERLQISEKSLWTGGPGSDGGYDYGLPAESQVAAMSAVSEQLLDGSTLAPEAVAGQLGRKMHNYGDYQSFGDLIIESLADDGETGGYRRELDLSTGMAREKFRRGFVGHL